MSLHNGIKIPQNLQAALDLAGQGIPAFPFRLVPSDTPGKGPVKRPCITDWQNRATTDKAQLRRWWAKWPDAMPGLPMGRRNGMAVLDLDQKNGKDGFAGLRAMGLDPETLSPVMVQSPGGSLHAYFRWPEGMGNSAAGLPPGVDVRGEGGYVAAPGATHAGGTYRLLSGSLTDDLPPWPEALKPRMKAKDPGQGEPTGLPFHVVRAALMALPNDGEAYGSRDDWLRIGMALHAETEGSEEGQEAWQAWSALWPGYDESATDAAWESFSANGGVTGWAIIHEAEGWGWSDPALTDLRRIEALEEAQADFDLCWSAEELENMHIAGIVGDPADIRPKTATVALSVNQDDFGAPMLQGDKPIINMHNAILYLGRNVDSVLPELRHNLMTARDEWRDGPLTDAALVLARTSLERLGLKTIGKELVADAALAVARFRQYHPIRDDLARVRHDGKHRLDSWLVRHAGAENSPYVRAVGRKFLIQMVARVMQPGCKADHTLVLSGPQGQNKSTACRILAGAEYFSDTLPSITGDKTDAIRHLQGKWLVELAELAPSRKSEAEDLKAFLSGAVDRVRLPYARFDQSFPRQCVFVGTTNEDQFLRDATGGRRFWPVAVSRVIDIQALAAERDQLLAEATAAFHAGEAWWLDRAFEAQHARPMQEAAFVSDGWGDAVAEWLDKTEDDFDGTAKRRAEVTVSDVLTEALGITSAQQTMAVQKRAGDVLRRLGWHKAKTMGRIVWRRVQA